LAISTVWIRSLADQRSLPEYLALFPEDEEKAVELYGEALGALITMAAQEIRAEKEGL
jgi:hypothetical protein